MADLAPWQFELDGLLMGPGTPYHVSTFDPGSADLRGQLSDAPRADGQQWGRGYRGGRVIAMDVSVAVRNPADAYAAASKLEATWDAEAIRSQPGALSVLRYRRLAGTRRVYGRTGKMASALRQERGGRIDFTAEFTTTDHRFYGDTVSTLVVPYVPAALGGLIGAQAGGWAATTAGVASGQLNVGGSVPAWLSWAIRGPITNPTIEVVGLWSATLQMQVAYDQTITVSPVPWERGVRRNDGASFAGAFTADSERLSQMRVPPGTSQVLLRGYDPTGTSSVSCAVRDIHASF